MSRAIAVIRHRPETITVETTDGRRIARAARILVVTTRRAPARLVWRLELARALVS